MGKLVTVKSNYQYVLLPNKSGDGTQANYKGGDTVTVTDAEYAAFNAATLAAITLTTSGLPDPARKATDPKAGNYASGNASGTLTLNLGLNDFTLTGNVTTVTVAADKADSITNGTKTPGVVGPKPGSESSYDVRLTQDGTGTRTVTWGSAFKFVGGSAPTLSTAAGKSDLLRFVTFDGGQTLVEVGRFLDVR